MTPADETREFAVQALGNYVHCKDNGVKIMQRRPVSPALGVFILAMTLNLMATTTAGAEERVMLIDDFESAGISSIGTQWQGFTDRVMGGRSTIQAGYRETDDGRVLSMRGVVSLENNGGFVQVRLPLGTDRTLDASGYTGVTVEARGEPGYYYVHLRTRQSRAPWQYYAAELPVSGEWQRIEIPFASFSGESIRRELDLSELVSLAIVGANHEFTADIDIRRIELVGRTDG
jgi:hypothetical protein